MARTIRGTWAVRAAQVGLALAVAASTAIGVVVGIGDGGGLASLVRGLAVPSVPSAHPTPVPPPPGAPTGS
jgi:hypothetical protein